MSQQQGNGLFMGSTYVINNALNAIPVVDGVLGTCVSAGKVSVDLASQSLALLTVQDAVLEACVSNNQLSVNVQNNTTILNFGSGYVNMATPFTAGVVSGNVINVLAIGTKQVCLFGRVVDWQSLADDTVAKTLCYV